MALAILNYWSPDGQLERSNRAKEDSSLRAVTIHTKQSSKYNSTENLSAAYMKHHLSTVIRSISAQGFTHS